VVPATVVLLYWVEVEVENENIYLFIYMGPLKNIYFIRVFHPFISFAKKTT